MKKTLHALRKKPEHVREQVAVFAAGLITLLVVVIWILSLSSRFEPANITVQDTTNMVAPQKPFSILFDSIEQVFQSQKETSIQPTIPEDTNSFNYDESGSYSEQFIGPEYSVTTSDMTTEMDTSKDQIQPEM